MSQDRPHAIKCRCGAQTQNFKNNIGPFFIAECCKAKGYDALGNKPGDEAPAAPKQAETAVQASTPSAELDKRKAEKEKLKAERAEEIAKRKAERDARAAEKAALNKKAQEESGSDENPAE